MVFKKDLTDNRLLFVHIHTYKSADRNRHFVLISGRGWKPCFTSNKPTHYPIEYGNFSRLRCTTHERFEGMDISQGNDAH